MTIKINGSYRDKICSVPIREREGISHGDNDDCLWVTQRAAKSGRNLHLDSDMFTVVVERLSDRPRFEVQIFIPVSVLASGIFIGGFH